MYSQQEMKNLFNYFKNGNYNQGIIIHLNISFSTKCQTLAIR